MNKTYFYGGAFNPMTISHMKIIQSVLLEMDKDDLLIVGITDHDYKSFQFNYELREKIVFENCLKYCNYPYKRVKIIKQDKRTWRFLNELGYKNYVLVVGEDEYIDLKDGKWHHSEDNLNSCEIKVIQRNDGVSASKVRELFKNKMFLTAMKYLTPVTIKLLPEYKNGIKYS